KKHEVTITAATNLNADDVEGMVQEAKVHKAEDRKRRELVDARNEGDTLAYQAEKALNELGDKVPEGDRTSIETKIGDLRGAIQGDELAKIKSLTEEVQQASYALSQQMYAQETPSDTAGGTQGSETSGEEEDDVVEGEFREA
ncbi:MAG: Hsp70 family protein, partial [Chloroflexi bacterium]|nr:Hsp70 family protein [Chloroflexota bacterium]